MEEIVETSLNTSFLENKPAKEIYHLVDGVMYLVGQLVHLVVPVCWLYHRNDCYLSCTGSRLIADP
jgi:hypothetical protein